MPVQLLSREKKCKNDVSEFKHMGTIKYVPLTCPRGYADQQQCVRNAFVCVRLKCTDCRGYDASLDFNVKTDTNLGVRDEDNVARGRERCTTR